MCDQVILIIGEVFIDTHLDIIYNGSPLVRLGGIFHAARAFSALRVSYALAYYAPDYLDDDINYWSLILKTKGCHKLGSIEHAPNVMLIRESTEAGNQGYINILKDQAKYTNLDSLVDVIKAVNPTDILLFPGRYDTFNIMKILENISCRLHIDIHYDSENLFNATQRDIDSIILSTSSSFFVENCHGTFSELVEYFKNHNVTRYLLKENRGGSVCYLPKEKAHIESAAYHVPIMHSVGVGDVYDSVFVSNFFDDDISKQMRFAALCAAKYAETMEFKNFTDNVNLVYENIDELKELVGIRLPWDKRKSINIYLASPDFPDINTKPLDDLYHSLIYHNFSPRRPVRENGLATANLSYKDEIEMYQKDVHLMNECDLLIAVLLNNDPGTLVELGMFKQAGKPTIIFDPFHYCTNMFVRHTPDYICKTLSHVIDSTYLCLGERKHDDF